MPTIYAHQRPNYRLYTWARERMREIDEQISQLTLERGLMETVAADCKAKHCSDCDGEGIVMKPIPGCECDGPRQHTCERCKGTGGVSAVDDKGVGTKDADDLPGPPSSDDRKEE
jgi:hypothetical protein